MKPNQSRATGSVTADAKRDAASRTAVSLPALFVTPRDAPATLPPLGGTTRTPPQRRLGGAAASVAAAASSVAREDDGSIDLSCQTLTAPAIVLVTGSAGLLASATELNLACATIDDVGCKLLLNALRRFRNVTRVIVDGVTAADPSFPAAAEAQCAENRSASDAAASERVQRLAAHRTAAHDATIGEALRQTVRAAHDRHNIEFDEGRERRMLRAALRCARAVSVAEGIRHAQARRTVAEALVLVETEAASRNAIVAARFIALGGVLQKRETDARAVGVASEAARRHALAEASREGYDAALADLRCRCANERAALAECAFRCSQARHGTSAEEREAFAAVFARFERDTELLARQQREVRYREEDERRRVRAQAEEDARDRELRVERARMLAAEFAAAVEVKSGRLGGVETAARRRVEGAQEAAFVNFGAALSELAAMHAEAAQFREVSAALRVLLATPPVVVFESRHGRDAPLIVFEPAEVVPLVTSPLPSLSQFPWALVDPHASVSLEMPMLWESRVNSQREECRRAASQTRSLRLTRLKRLRRCFDDLLQEYAKMKIKASFASDLRRASVHLTAAMLPHPDQPRASARQRGGALATPGTTSVRRCSGGPLSATLTTTPSTSLGNSVVLRDFEVPDVSIREEMTQHQYEPEWQPTLTAAMLQPSITGTLRSASVGTVSMLRSIASPSLLSADEFAEIDATPLEPLVARRTQVASGRITVKVTTLAPSMTIDRGDRSAPRTTAVGQSGSGGEQHACASPPSRRTSFSSLTGGVRRRSRVQPDVGEAMFLSPHDGEGGGPLVVGRSDQLSFRPDPTSAAAHGCTAAAAEEVDEAQREVLSASATHAALTVAVTEPASDGSASRVEEALRSVSYRSLARFGPRVAAFRLITVTVTINNLWNATCHIPVAICPVFFVPRTISRRLDESSIECSIGDLWTVDDAPVALLPPSVAATPSNRGRGDHVEGGDCSPEDLIRNIEKTMVPVVSDSEGSDDDHNEDDQNEPRQEPSAVEPGEPNGEAGFAATCIFPTASAEPAPECGPAVSKAASIRIERTITSLRKGFLETPSSPSNRATTVLAPRLAWDEQTIEREGRLPFVGFAGATLTVAIESGALPGDTIYLNERSGLLDMGSSRTPAELASTMALSKPRGVGAVGAVGAGGGGAQSVSPGGGGIQIVLGVVSLNGQIVARVTKGAFTRFAPVTGLAVHELVFVDHLPIRREQVVAILEALRFAVAPLAAPVPTATTPGGTSRSGLCVGLRRLSVSLCLPPPHRCAARVLLAIDVHAESSRRRLHLSERRVYFRAQRTPGSTVEEPTDASSSASALSASGTARRNSTKRSARRRGDSGAFGARGGASVADEGRSARAAPPAGAGGRILHTPFVRVAPSARVVDETGPTFRGGFVAMWIGSGLRWGDHLWVANTDGQPTSTSPASPQPSPRPENQPGHCFWRPGIHLRPCAPRRKGSEITSPPSCQDNRAFSVGMSIGRADRSLSRSPLPAGGASISGGFGAGLGRATRGAQPPQVIQTLATSPPVAAVWYDDACIGVLRAEYFAPDAYRTVTSEENAELLAVSKGSTSSAGYAGWAVVRRRSQAARFVSAMSGVAPAGSGLRGSQQQQQPELQPHPVENRTAWTCRALRIDFITPIIDDRDHQLAVQEDEGRNPGLTPFGVPPTSETPAYVSVSAVQELLRSLCFSSGREVPVLGYRDIHLLLQMGPSTANPRALRQMPNANQVVTVSGATSPSAMRSPQVLTWSLPGEEDKAGGAVREGKDGGNAGNSSPLVSLQPSPDDDPLIPEVDALTESIAGEPLPALMDTVVLRVTDPLLSVPLRASVPVAASTTPTQRLSSFMTYMENCGPRRFPALDLLPDDESGVSVFDSGFLRVEIVVGSAPSDRIWPREVDPNEPGDGSHQMGSRRWKVVETTTIAAPTTSGSTAQESSRESVPKHADNVCLEDLTPPQNAVELLAAITTLGPRWLPLEAQSPACAPPVKADSLMPLFPSGAAPRGTVNRRATSGGETSSTNGSRSASTTPVRRRPSLGRNTSLGGGGSAGDVLVLSHSHSPGSAALNGSVAAVASGLLGHRGSISPLRMTNGGGSENGGGSAAPFRPVSAARLVGSQSSGKLLESHPQLPADLEFERWLPFAAAASPPADSDLKEAEVIPLRAESEASDGHPLAAAHRAAQRAKQLAAFGVDHRLVHPTSLGSSGSARAATLCTFDLVSAPSMARATMQTPTSPASSASPLSSTMLSSLVSSPTKAISPLVPTLLPSSSSPRTVGDASHERSGILASSSSSPSFTVRSISYSTGCLIYWTGTPLRRRDIASLLQTLAYSNDDPNPRVFRKTVEVTFFDGSCRSETRFGLAILPVDDPVDVFLHRPVLPYRVGSLESNPFDVETSRLLVSLRQQHLLPLLASVEPAPLGKVSSVQTSRRDSDVVGVDTARRGPVSPAQASAVLPPSSSVVLSATTGSGHYGTARAFDGLVELPPTSADGALLRPFAPGTVSLEEPRPQRWFGGSMTVSVQGGGTRQEGLAWLSVEQQRAQWSALLLDSTSGTQKWTHQPILLALADDPSLPLSRGGLLNVIDWETGAVRIRGIASLVWVSRPQQPTGVVVTLHGEKWKDDPAVGGAKRTPSELGAAGSHGSGDGGAEERSQATPENRNESDDDDGNSGEDETECGTPVSFFASALACLWYRFPTDAQSFGATAATSLPSSGSATNLLQSVAPSPSVLPPSGARTLRVAIADIRNPSPARAVATIEVAPPVFTTKENTVRTVAAVTRTRAKEDSYHVFQRFSLSSHEKDIFVGGYLEIFAVSAAGGVSSLSPSLATSVVSGGGANLPVLIPGVMTAPDCLTLRFSGTQLSIRDGVLLFGKETLGRIVVSPQYIRLDFADGPACNARRLQDLIRAVFLVFSTAGERTVILALSEPCGATSTGSPTQPKGFACRMSPIYSVIVAA